MLILIRTDIGLMRLINTEDIAYADALGSQSINIELKSKPDFVFKIGMGIENFYKVVKGEAEFMDLYVDQGYQKTIENSSKELESLEIKPETVESKKDLEEFKETLKPLKPISTFSKKKANDEAKTVVDKTESAW